ncbi:MAG TPA: flagellar export chaperone FlgN [Phycisphaerae bacterium]|jgi:hypothetical protein|nr:flagellar protein FlgN [Phycisphaerae bacterium]HOB75274.1 flagellar export chaperone FlgN [Phycisphaerae bacterium]HOJ55050.1 flagellar export chaperone FlgN [Phycisphaerae bacterium]HOL27791.1 flagellar export chaperone FlgN [Phycisphaerae bacterium]HPP22000.1 flagellar export chaperone FlgN [Phycisphaerae bacterium]
MASLSVQPDLLVRDLVRLLADLAALHQELAGHAKEKLEAIRRADSDAITAITAREMPLVERLAEREGLRRQLTRRIAGALGVEPGQADGIRVGELASRLPQPQAGQLLAAAAGLRQKVEELKRLQRTTALITQEMLKHLNEVVAVMCGGRLPADSYTRGGQRVRPESAGVFEAVG